MARQILDNQIGYRGNRANCLYFDMDGFANFILVVFDADKKHINDEAIMIQSEGFCPIGLRYIYEGFLLDFMFADANDHAVWGTRCNHQKKTEVRT